MPALGPQGVWTGTFGIPKQRESVSARGDGLSQVQNTSRKVFKTQRVLQARAEDLTAVLF